MSYEETKELEHMGVPITIWNDTNDMGPDEWKNEDLFLVGFHRDFSVDRYGFGIDVCRDIASGKKSDEAKAITKKYHTFNLEAYIHSGVVLALSREGNFPDRNWDVSQLGMVFVAKAEWKTKAKAREAALSLITEWNQNLSGEVYGYTIGDHEDSCGGFYGLEYCIEQAKEAAEYVAKKNQKAKEARLKTMILNRVPLSKR